MNSELTVTHADAYKPSIGRILCPEAMLRAAVRRRFNVVHGMGCGPARALAAGSSRHDARAARRQGRPVRLCPASPPGWRPVQPSPAVNSRAELGAALLPAEADPAPSAIRQ